MTTNRNWRIFAVLSVLAGLLAVGVILGTDAQAAPKPTATVDQIYQVGDPFTQSIEDKTRCTVVAIGAPLQGYLQFFQIDCYKPGRYGKIHQTIWIGTRAGGTAVFFGGWVTVFPESRR